MWTDDDLLRLDARYAEAGIPFHARPLRAAMDLLGNRFVIGGGNTEVHAITQAYSRLIPEVNTTWPGKGIGLAASIDRVRKVTVGVVYGKTAITPEKALGFDNHEEWSRWCRNDPTIAASSCFAFADLFDLTYGIDELRHSSPVAAEYWHLALSNLEDVANVLSSGFSVSTVLQPICMTAELAMKANLIHLGADPKTLSHRDVGHRHTVLAQRMREASPHRDDELVAVVSAALPDYVSSRYKTSGLTRLNAIKLALGVQFIAASSVRRLTGRDMANDMEQSDWPGRRKLTFED